MQSAVSPIEDYVVKGTGQTFFSVFNYPLLFSNTVDKKATYAKKLAENPSLKLPFAVASYTSDEIDETRYSSLTLARRGVYLAPLNDNTQVFNVKLLPVTTTFKLTLYSEDLTSLRRFANKWLFAAKKNALNFSFTYGSADFDVKVELEQNIQYPDSSSGVDEPKEYELSSSFKVLGFMSEPWTRVQVATEVSVTGDFGSIDAVARAATGDTSGVTQFFEFNRKWDKE